MNMRSGEFVLIESAQIVTAIRADLAGLLELERGDLDAIPRSGFDVPTAEEFLGLIGSWSDAAAQLLDSLAAFEDALREQLPAGTRIAPNFLGGDPGNATVAQVLGRLFAELEPRSQQWPHELRAQYAEASTQWRAAAEQLAYVKQQVEYLLLGVGSDA